MYVLNDPLVVILFLQSATINYCGVAEQIERKDSCILILNDASVFRSRNLRETGVFHKLNIIGNKKKPDL